MSKSRAEIVRQGKAMYKYHKNDKLIKALSKQIFKLCGCMPNMLLGDIKGLNQKRRVGK